MTMSTKLTVVSRRPAGDWSGHRPAAVNNKSRRRLSVVAQTCPGSDCSLAVAVCETPGRLGAAAVPAVLAGLGMVDDAGGVEAEHGLLLMLGLMMVMMMMLMETVGGYHVRTTLWIIVVISGDVFIGGRVIISHGADMGGRPTVRRKTLATT